MFDLFKDYFNILITSIYSLCDGDLEDPPEEKVEKVEKVEIVVIDDYI